MPDCSSPSNTAITTHSPSTQLWSLLNEFDFQLQRRCPNRSRSPVPVLWSSLLLLQLVLQTADLLIRGVFWCNLMNEWMNQSMTKWLNNWVSDSEGGREVGRRGKGWKEGGKEGGGEREERREGRGRKGRKKGGEGRREEVTECASEWLRHAVSECVPAWMNVTMKEHKGIISLTRSTWEHVLPLLASYSSSRQAVSVNILQTFLFLWEPR